MYGELKRKKNGEKRRKMDRQKLVEILFKEKVLELTDEIEDLMRDYRESIGKRHDLSKKVDYLEAELKKVGNIGSYLEDVIIQRDTYKTALRKRETEIKKMKRDLEDCDDVLLRAEKAEREGNGWKLVSDGKTIQLEKMAKENERLKASLKGWMDWAAETVEFVALLKRRLAERGKENAEVPSPDLYRDLYGANTTYSSTAPGEKK